MAEVSICNYYNDHQTAASLMIDDLAPTAITPRGELKPYYDHGYGAHHKDGLFHYFQREFLDLFPEARGSFFILINRHFQHGPNEGGYEILNDGFDNNYLEFLNSLQPRFDFAYHGTTHGRKSDHIIEQEFSYLTKADIPRLKKAIEAFEKKSGIRFEGGKFPAYQSNAESEAIVETLGFKWWAFSHAMKNRRHMGNDISYSGQENKLLNFPTNFSGDSFKTFLKKSNSKMGVLKPVVDLLQKQRLEGRLQSLYEKAQIISVQEHFTTLRADGKYQRPNVFDDLLSLRHIYGVLRGADIWHEGCNAIARYLENRDHSQLELTEGGFIVSYNGRYPDCEISLKSTQYAELSAIDGQVLRGVRRNNHWVFNGVKAGEYRFGG